MPTTLCRRGSSAARCVHCSLTAWLAALWLRICDCALLVARAPTVVCCIVVAHCWWCSAISAAAQQRTNEPAVKGRAWPRCIHDTAGAAVLWVYLVAPGWQQVCACAQQCRACVRMLAAFAPDCLPVVLSCQRAAGARAWHAGTESSPPLACSRTTLVAGSPLLLTDCSLLPAATASKCRAAPSPADA